MSKNLFPIFNPDKKWYDIKNIGNDYTIDITGLIGGKEQEEGEYLNYNQTKEWWDNELQWLKNITPDTITINILNSPGGSALYALAMFDLLQSNKAKVFTNAIGYCASAATIIFSAASKGCRGISENAAFLIHRSTAEIWGNVDEMMNGVEFNRMVEERICNIYAGCTGKTKEEIFSIMSENSGLGTWRNAEETIALGLADFTIKKYKVAANAIENLKHLKNLPELKIENNMEKTILEQLSEKVTEVFNYIKGTKTEQKPDFTSIENKITDIQNEVNIVKAENETLKTTVENHVSEITTLKESVTAKDAEILKIKNDFSEYAKSTGKEVEFTGEETIIKNGTDPLSGPKLSRQAQKIKDHAKGKFHDDSKSE